MRAAVSLTDLHQTDRRRPDRAIDALDEACAHTHAIARYTPRTERLIARRRELLRVAERAQQAVAAAQEDEVDQWARNGFAALQRFGAEIEAMFVGAPLDRNGGTAPAPAPDPETVTPPSAPADDMPATLGEVEVELDAALREEGMVVRGVDVARVVAVSTGREVQWAAA
jgi:ATP-dependent Clp protease ATP-binding subunit ClpA